MHPVYLLKRILLGNRGFTLVEMVVVIAIMGVMAAVAVPVVTNTLTKSRGTAYDQDLAMIQTAVDSYFSAVDNVRHLGLRQYPINALKNSGDPVLWEDLSLPIYGDLPNPHLGTQGGQPFWRDTGNGERDSLIPGAPTEGLSLDNTVNLTTLPPDRDSWYMAKVEFRGKEYAVDSRGYFIDFNELLQAGLLQRIPESASTDNGGVTSIGGSYSWYINQFGAVESILGIFPYNGLALDDGIAGTALIDQPNDPTAKVSSAFDLRGFQEGVYP